MTDAMKSTVMSGTPRHNSMKATDIALMIGMSERRPSASRIPSGRAATMPTAERTSVSVRPPQRLVSTCSRPKAPPESR